jgi:hypothetical protein
MMQGSETVEWWNTTWKYRVPVIISSINEITNITFGIQLNFSRFLADVGCTNCTFDNNSIRVVMVNDSGNFVETPVSYASEIIASESEFTPIDLSGLYNAQPRYVWDGGKGYTAWFTQSPVKLKGIPFLVPTSPTVDGAISGSRGGLSSHIIPINQNMIRRIYVLSSAAWGSTSNLNKYSITVIYENGTSFEVIPTNFISRKAKIYDWCGNNDKAAITFEGTSCTAGVFNSYIVTSPITRILNITINDKHTGMDFALYALTLEKLRYTQPILKWIVTGRLTPGENRTYYIF